MSTNWERLEGDESFILEMDKPRAFNLVRIISASPQVTCFTHKQSRLWKLGVVDTYYAHEGHVNSSALCLSIFLQDCAEGYSD